MPSSSKKFSSLLKKTFIKLINRKWLLNHTWYSNRCFLIAFNNDLQKRKCTEIANFLAQCGYSVQFFDKCVKINTNTVYTNPGNYSMAKIVMAKKWSKLR